MIKELLVLNQNVHAQLTNGKIMEFVKTVLTNVVLVIIVLNNVLNVLMKLEDLILLVNV